MTATAERTAEQPAAFDRAAAIDTLKAAGVDFPGNVSNAALKDLLAQHNGAPEQPPIDNKHVAEGATKFTDGEIKSAAAPKAKPVNPAPKSTTSSTKGPVKIMPGDFKLAVHSQAEFKTIIQNPDVTVDDVLRPEFWSHVGEMLSKSCKSHPFALINVWWADGSRYMQLAVLDAGPLWAAVRPVHTVEFGAMDYNTDALETFTVKRINAATGWAVIRAADGNIMRKGYGTREEAEREKEDLIRQMRK